MDRSDVLCGREGVGKQGIGGEVKPLFLFGCEHLYMFRTGRTLNGTSLATECPQNSGNSCNCVTLFDTRRQRIAREYRTTTFHIKFKFVNEPRPAYAKYLFKK